MSDGWNHDWAGDADASHYWACRYDFDKILNWAALNRWVDLYATYLPKTLRKDHNLERYGLLP